MCGDRPGTVWQRPNVWHQRRAQRVRCMPGLGRRLVLGWLARPEHGLEVFALFRGEDKVRPRHLMETKGPTARVRATGTWLTRVERATARQATRRTGCPRLLPPLPRQLCRTPRRDWCQPYEWSRSHIEERAAQRRPPPTRAQLRAACRSAASATDCRTGSGPVEKQLSRELPRRRGRDY